MSDYLPPEVVTDILSRLPVKSLLKFRCVSKSWCSLIKSPNFIRTHLNQAKTNKYLHQQKLLLTRYMSPSSRNEQYSLRFENADDDFDEYALINCPFRARIYFRVVGVCNGLICLSDDHFGHLGTIIIWNPAIRRFLKLPQPSVNFESYGPYMFALGFGFDVLKGECKVVRLAYLQRREGQNMFVDTPKVEVYVAGASSWRRVRKGVPSCSIVESVWSQAFLNGSVHWAGSKIDGSGLLNVVLWFNMAEEKFGMFEFPEPSVKGMPLQFSIGLCGDSLALFAYDNPINCNCFAVYVMKEYGVAESWSKVYRIEMKIGKILGFRKDGEILVATTDNKLASYETNSKQTKDLGISGYQGSLYTAAYEESLALLNGIGGDFEFPLKDYESLATSEDSSDEEDEVDKDYIDRHIQMHYVFAAASIPGFTFQSLA